MLSGTLSIAAALIWIVSARRPGLAVPAQVWWPVLAVAFAGTDLAAVHFEFRNENYALNLQSAVLVVALVFCSPLQLLAARVGGTLLGLGVGKRLAPVKLSFNLAQQTLRMGVAVLVLHGIIGSHSPVSPWGWLALLATAFTSDRIGEASILAVIGVTSGALSWRMVAEVAVAGPFLCTAAAIIGLIAVSVLWVNIGGIWMLVAVGSLLAGVHRMHHRLRRRYSNLDRLYQFTSDLGEVRSTETLTFEVLDKARSLLRARHASLVVAGPTGLLRATVDDSGRRFEGAIEPGALERVALSEQAALCIPRTATGRLAAALEADGLRDALAVPVAGDGVPGALVLADRMGEVSTFDQDELKLLEALAGAAGVALQRGRLVEQLRSEIEAKHHQALHDSLTGLGNRALFAEKLDTAVARRGPGEQVAVLLMDCDEFKEINDTLGHDVGDAVLVHIASRLEAAIGDEGVVARLGGDEFAILVEAQPAGGVTDLADRARRAVEEPIRLFEMILQVRASIGISMAPDHGEDAAMLMRRADVAMYTAKAARSGVAVYSADKDHYSPRRLSLLGDLDRAITDNQLRLHYQPKADLATREVTGMEALLRWTHPVYGPIGPDEFIPASEQSGLIGRVTRWVLDEALRQQAEWAAAGVDLGMAVNISARSLVRADLVEEIEDVLRGAGVAPARLTLEITETSVMADADRSIALLGALSAMGLRLSIDDFGTGYSSLARLGRMPVDEVKIDRSLIGNMLRDPSDLAVVRTTIDLARHLSLHVVAEGVEDKLTWQRLRSLGCESAQGYFMAKPMPASDVPGWLRAWDGQEAQARVEPIRGRQLQLGEASR